MKMKLIIVYCITLIGFVSCSCGIPRRKPDPPTKLKEEYLDMVLRRNENLDEPYRRPFCTEEEQILWLFRGTLVTMPSDLRSKLLNARKKGLPWEPYEALMIEKKVAPVSPKPERCGFIRRKQKPNKQLMDDYLDLVLENEGRLVRPLARPFCIEEEQIMWLLRGKLETMSSQLKSDILDARRNKRPWLKLLRSRSKSTEKPKTNVVKEDMPTRSTTEYSSRKTSPYLRPTTARTITTKKPTTVTKKTIYSSTTRATTAVTTPVSTTSTTTTRKPIMLPSTSKPEKKVGSITTPKMMKMDDSSVSTVSTNPSTTSSSTTLSTTPSTTPSSTTVSTTPSSTTPSSTTPTLTTPSSTTPSSTTPSSTTPTSTTPTSTTPSSTTPTSTTPTSTTPSSTTPSPTTSSPTTSSTTPSSTPSSTAVSATPSTTPSSTAASATPSSTTVSATALSTDLSTISSATTTSVMMNMTTKKLTTPAITEPVLFRDKKSSIENRFGGSNTSPMASPSATSTTSDPPITIITISMTPLPLVKNLVKNGEISPTTSSSTTTIVTDKIFKLSTTIIPIPTEDLPPAGPSDIGNRFGLPETEDLPPAGPSDIGNRFGLPETEEVLKLIPTPVEMTDKSTSTAKATSKTDTSSATVATTSKIDASNSKSTITSMTDTSSTTPKIAGITNMTTASLETTTEAMKITIVTADPCFDPSELYDLAGNSIDLPMPGTIKTKKPGCRI